MKLNNFGVSVRNHIEDKDGYVKIKHGEVYSLVLNNLNPERCDATVYIDGKDVGTFRVNGYETINLERPDSIDRKFTFYKLDSSEATEAGLSNSDKLGLISVVFKPELYQPSLDSYLDMSTRSFLTASAGIRHPGPTVTNFNIDASVGARGMSAGGTGLSEASSQRFTTVANLNYDESKETTIHLRLVLDSPSIVPLPDNRKRSTPIPKPIS